jgi:hypothetical protein
MNKELALKAIGEFMWRDRAKERVQSKASRRADDASLGKERRFTGTLKLEISVRSHFFSPSRELRTRSIGACAAELPGVVLS